MTKSESDAYAAPAGEDLRSRSLVLRDDEAGLNDVALGMNGGAVGTIFDLKVFVADGEATSSILSKEDPSCADPGLDSSRGIPRFSMLEVNLSSSLAKESDSATSTSLVD